MVTPRKSRVLFPEEEEMDMAGYTQIRDDYFSPPPGAAGQPWPGGPPLRTVDRFWVCPGVHLRFRYSRAVLALLNFSRQCGSMIKLLDSGPVVNGKCPAHILWTYPLYDLGSVAQPSGSSTLYL